MKRTAWAAWAVLPFILANPTHRMVQQSGRLLLSEGIAAYRDLEFAAAGRLIRRALEAPVRPPLTDTERNNALMYLGASELLLGNRARAVQAFRELVLDAPRFVPDSLVFPPRIALVFHETARATKGVAVTLPSVHTIRSRDSGLSVTLTVTSPHLVMASVLTSRGALVRRLFDGTVDDATQVTWNGAGLSGETVPAGRYRLEVASLVTPGTVLRLVRIPLEVARTPVDTIAWPPRPVPAVQKPDVRFLVPGAAAALLLGLPPILGNVSGEGTRLALAATAAAIALAGGLRTSRVPSAEDQRDWAGTVASVREENARRRANPTLIVRAGEPQRLETDSR